MTASDMIMSSWELGLSMLICLVPYLIPIKFTFLFLIPLLGADPGIRFGKKTVKLCESTNQSNVHGNHIHSCCQSSGCPYLTQEDLMYFTSIWLSVSKITFVFPFLYINSSF